jgi:hypothetical protein
MTRNDDDTPDPRADRVLDRVLSELRQTYNAPPANPPFEAMWAAIDRSLDAAQVVPLRAIPAAARPRRSPERTGWGLGIAAALLMGVGIGRMSAGSGAVEPAQQVALNGPATPAPDPAARASDPVRPKPSGPERVGGESATDQRPGTGGGPERSTGARVPSGARLVLAEQVPYGLQTPAETPDEESSPRRYLGQATALLIALDGDAPRSGDDSRLVRRASELLTTTRLLLDAPTVDEKTRALLEDLELVLTQVVRLQTESGREDLRLIREALEQRDLLPRLHTAVVAGSDD